MKFMLFCYGFSVAILRDWFYLAILALFVLAMIGFIWAVFTAGVDENE